MKIIHIANKEIETYWKSYWIDPMGKTIFCPYGHIKAINQIAKDYNFQIPQGLYDGRYKYMYLRNFIRATLYSRNLLIEGNSTRTVNENQKRAIVDIFTNSNSCSTICAKFEKQGAFFNISDLLKFLDDSEMQSKIEEDSEIPEWMRANNSIDIKKYAEGMMSYWLTPTAQLQEVTGEDVIHRNMIPILAASYNLDKNKDYIKDGMIEFFKAGFVRINSGNSFYIELYIPSVNEQQKQKIMEMARNREIYIDSVQDGISYRGLNREDLYEILNGSIKKYKSYYAKSNDWYKIAKNNDYVILGLTNEDGTESYKANPDKTHRNMSWSTTVSFSFNWTYLPNKKAIFSWHDIPRHLKENIISHLQEKYGINNISFDCLSRYGDEVNDIDPIKRTDSKKYKMAAWYHQKEEKQMKRPYKITKVVRDSTEDIQSLKGIIMMDVTPYGALNKFLKKYPFLYDYIEAGIDLVAVVDETKLKEVQENWQRKLDEEQRIKDEEVRNKMKSTWYGNDD